jgi:predicted AAA+ superfamily ATPase
LVETMIVGDLRVQAGSLEAPVRLSHYRDKAGYEVDLVVESHRGAVFGLGVGLASSPGAEVWRGLNRLREAAGDRLAGGVVLCRVPAGPVD